MANNDRMLVYEMISRLGRREEGHDPDLRRLEPLGSIHGGIVALKCGFSHQSRVIDIAK